MTHEEDASLPLTLQPPRIAAPRRRHELIVQVLKVGTSSASGTGIDNGDVGIDVDSDIPMIDSNDTKKKCADRTIIRLPLLIGENWLQWYEWECEYKYPCEHDRTRTRISQQSHPTPHSHHSYVQALPTIVSLSEELSDMVHLPPSHEEINNSRPNTSQNSTTGSDSTTGSTDDLSVLLLNHTNTNANATTPVSAGNNHHPPATLTASTRQCCYLCFDVVLALPTNTDSDHVSNTTGNDNSIGVTMKDMRDPIIPDSFSHSHGIVHTNHSNNHHWTIHLHPASSSSSAVHQRRLPTGTGDDNPTTLPVQRRHSYQLQHGDSLKFRQHNHVAMIVQYQDYTISETQQQQLQQRSVASRETQSRPATQLPPPTAKIWNTEQSDDPVDTQLTSQDDDFDETRIDAVNEFFSQNDDTNVPTQSATVFHSAVDMNLSTQQTTIANPSKDEPVLHLSALHQSIHNDRNDHEKNIEDDDNDDVSTIDPRISLRKKTSARSSNIHKTTRNVDLLKNVVNDNVDSSSSQLPLLVVNKGDSKTQLPPAHITTGHDAIFTSTMDNVPTSPARKHKESSLSSQNMYSPDLLAATPVQGFIDDHAIPVSTMTNGAVDKPLDVKSTRQSATDSIPNNNDIHHSDSSDVPIPNIFETAVSSSRQPHSMNEGNNTFDHRGARLFADSDSKDAVATIVELVVLSESKDFTKDTDVVNDNMKDTSTTPAQNTRRKCAILSTPAAAIVNTGSTGRSKRLRLESVLGKHNNNSGTSDVMNRPDTIRILTTGFELDEKQKLMVRAIPGAQWIEHLHEAHTATHVIATNGITDIRRTCKLMIAICRANFVLTLDWLIDSSKQRKALDTAPYRIKHDAPYCRSLEQQYASFSMRTTLRNIEHRKTLLFHGWHVYICPKVAGHKAPTTNEFQYIIYAAGATYVSTFKNFVVSNSSGCDGTGDDEDTRAANILVITSDPPTKIQLSHISTLAKDPLEIVRVHHHTTTWFFDTIMTQEIVL